MRQFPGEELFIDWTQDEEHAKDLKKIGDLIHDEYLKKRREEKKRKSALNLLDEGDIKTSKMQKKVEEEVKEEKVDIVNGNSENGFLLNTFNPAETTEYGEKFG